MLNKLEGDSSVVISLHVRLRFRLSLEVCGLSSMAVLSIFLCSIVESFEAIAQNLVNQENFTRIEVVGDDVTLVGERVRMWIISLILRPFISPMNGLGTRLVDYL